MTGPAVCAEFARVDCHKSILIVAMAGFTTSRLKASQPFRMAVLASKRLVVRSDLMRCQTEAKQVVIDLKPDDLG